MAFTQTRAFQLGILLNYKRNDLVFYVTPFKLSLNPKYKEGNALVANPPQHVFPCSKSAKLESN